jgi:uncharacterized membrane protein
MLERFPASALAVGAKRRRFGRFVWTVAAILVLGLGPALGVAEEAAADLTVAPRHDVTFENHSGQTVYVAIMEHRGGSCQDTDWMVRGWWTVPPGDTMTYSTYAGSLWYYAETADGGKYSGDLNVYVSNNAFEYCMPPGGVTWDLGADYYLVGMNEIDLRPYTDYTMTLT